MKLLDVQWKAVKSWCALTFASNTGFHWARPLTWAHSLLWVGFLAAISWFVFIGAARWQESLVSRSIEIGEAATIVWMSSFGWLLIGYEACRRLSEYLSKRRFNKIPKEWREKNAGPRGLPTAPGWEMHGMVSAYEKEMAHQVAALKTAKQLEGATPSCLSKPSARRL